MAWVATAKSDCRCIGVEKEEQKPEKKKEPFDIRGICRNEVPTSVFTISYWRVITMVLAKCEALLKYKYLNIYTNWASQNYLAFPPLLALPEMPNFIKPIVRVIVLHGTILWHRNRSQRIQTQTRSRNPSHYSCRFLAAPEVQADYRCTWRYQHILRLTFGCGSSVS